MAIRFYDEALVNKIKKWDKDSRLQILSPNESYELFAIKADEGNDRPIELPFVSLSRDSTIRINNVNKKPMTFSGARIINFDKNGNECKEKSAFQLNAIPITLEYQLDIYTRKFVEADEYIRNFIFNFINMPNLEISIPYNNTNLRHKSTIHLSENVQDNSDIPQRIFKGQFTRFTITLVVDDAYLFSVPNKEYWRIDEADLEVEDLNSKIEWEEPLLEESK